MHTPADMVVVVILFPKCKAEAITTDEFIAEFSSNYCSHDASATPNYWHPAIGRTTFSVRFWSSRRHVLSTAR
jgi:hypothetical protein